MICIRIHTNHSKCIIMQYMTKRLNIFIFGLFFYDRLREKIEDGEKMIKFGKGVVKCRFLILILAFLLLIPSAIGYMKTRINYDILSYLPGQIETMKGQDILLDEFGTGAFSFVVVEGMQDKDLQKIADKIEDVPHVKNVIWYGSIMDFSIPREALPDDIYNFFNNKDADSQLMAVLFDESMSSDGTMDAIQTINDLVGKQCFVSGMASVNNDIRKLAENESVIYVLIAVVLSLIVLSLTMDSVVVPFLFLISIGMAIIYNLGSNVFFGEISYITKALAAVLQLGVQWIIPFSCGTVIRSRRSGLTEIKTVPWHMRFPIQLLPWSAAPLQQLPDLSHCVL